MFEYPAGKCPLWPSPFLFSAVAGVSCTLSKRTKSCNELHLHAVALIRIRRAYGNARNRAVHAPEQGDPRDVPAFDISAISDIGRASRARVME